MTRVQQTILLCTTASQLTDYNGFSVAEQQQPQCSPESMRGIWRECSPCRLNKHSDLHCTRCSQGKQLASLPRKFRRWFPGGNDTITCQGWILLGWIYPIICVMLLGLYKYVCVCLGRSIIRQRFLNPHIHDLQLNIKDDNDDGEIQCIIPKFYALYKLDQ